MIFLQLFIAVILQGYDDTQMQESRLFNIDMSTRFREVWADFDPQATTFIKISQLRDFLIALGSPLGFSDLYDGKRHLQDKFIASLELPMYFDFSKYQFLDVLDALSFRVMVIDHMKRQHGEKAEIELDLMDPEEEMRIKQELQKEINKLIFQRKSEGIMAVQDMLMREMK